MCTCIMKRQTLLIIYYPSSFSMAQQPLVCQDILIIDVVRSHSETPHSVGLFSTRDQAETETFT
jgi:hypothetical protein